jgi:hypothetical protein
MAAKAASRSGRRGWVVAGVCVLLWAAGPLAGSGGAQLTVPSSFAAEIQARVCGSLRSLDTAFSAYEPVRQTLASLLVRFGCTIQVPPGSTTTTTGGSTTTTSSTVPTSTVPSSTTTTFHLDCPLPGGGVGPCPTTSTSSFPFPTFTVPTITVPNPNTTIPGSTTTTVHFDCPLPGGGVGPCPTTTTSRVP